MPSMIGSAPGAPTVARVIGELWARLGRNPTLSQLARELECPEWALGRRVRSMVAADWCTWERRRGITVTPRGRADLMSVGFE